MKGIVFVSYGMGGALVETWESGLRLFVQRCKAIGLDTMQSPYQWSDVGLIMKMMNAAPPNVPVAVVGASLGANEAPDIASRTKRPIKYVAGFQTSTYGGKFGVPSNVEFADNIYNPSWLQTFGLGYQQWSRASGNKYTVLRNIPIQAPHPDDWGVAQDVIFSALHKHMVGPS